MVRRGRNLLRFGLRSILVLTTIVAVVCGVWLREVQVQRDVCDRLAALDIEVNLDSPSDWYSWLPQSILSLGDGHYFCRVTGVNLNVKTGSTQDRLRHDNDLIFLVSKLPRLERLEIEDALVDPKDFPLLARIRRLSVLELGYGELLDEDLALMPKLPCLKTLELSGNDRLTGKHIDVGRYPSLEHLYLNTTSLSDESLVEIGRIGTLKAFAMAYTPISDVGIAALFSLKQLLFLDVTSTRVSGVGVGALESLEKIDLSETRLVDAAFPEIRKLTKLKYLSFGHCPFVTDEAVRALEYHPALETIYATDCGITDACTESLATIATLDYLWLEDSNIRSLGKLAECKKLGTIAISSNEISIEDASRFADHKRFELYIRDPVDEPQSRSMRSCFRSCFGSVISLTSDELASMNGKTIGGNGETLFFEGLSGLRAKHLQNLTYNVREISLARSKAHNDFYQELVNWPLLSSLDVSKAAITEQDLVAIGAITRLTSLELDSTVIDDESLHYLASLSNLSTLGLGRTKITAESMPVLEQYKKLETLTIPFMPDAARLIDLLNACPSLNSVTLHQPGSLPVEIVTYDGVNLLDLEITPDELSELRKVMLFRSSEPFSSFAGRRVGDEHCARLAQFSEITSIDVAGSAVTDVGLAELAKLSALESLNVSNTGVTVAGLRSFESHENLLILNCVPCDWSAEQIEVFFELKSLRELSFPFSKLSPNAARAFLDKYVENEWLSWSEGGSDFTDVHYFCGDVNALWLLGKSSFEPSKNALTLAGSLVDNAKLAEVSGSPTTFDVTVQNVRCDSGLLVAKLLEFTNTRFLTLRGVAVSPEDLKRLRELRQLTVLTVEDCKLTKEHLAELVGLESVSMLNVANTEFDPAEFVDAIKASSIQKVFLKKTGRDEVEIRFLQSQLGKRLEVGSESQSTWGW